MVTWVQDNVSDMGVLPLSAVLGLRLCREWLRRCWLVGQRWQQPHTTQRADPANDSGVWLTLRTPDIRNQMMIEQEEANK